MYSLRDFGEMIADRSAVEATATPSLKRSGRAIVWKLAVGQGYSGSGLSSGARRLRIDQRIVHFARELADANGFADRMEFIQSDSRKVQLPEAVNVISRTSRIASIFAMPLHRSKTPASVSCAGGRLIPSGIP